MIFSFGKADKYDEQQILKMMLTMQSQYVLEVSVLILE